MGLSQSQPEEGHTPRYHASSSRFNTSTTNPYGEQRSPTHSTTRSSTAHGLRTTALYPDLDEAYGGSNVYSYGRTSRPNTSSSVASGYRGSGYNLNSPLRPTSIPRDTIQAESSRFRDSHSRLNRETNTYHLPRSTGTPNTLGVSSPPEASVQTAGTRTSSQPYKPDAGRTTPLLANSATSRTPDPILRSSVFTGSVGTGDQQQRTSTSKLESRGMCATNTLKQSTPMLERERQPYHMSYMATTSGNASASESNTGTTASSQNIELGTAKVSPTAGTCPCCMESIQNPVLLPCFHCLCRDCLELNLAVQMSQQQDGSEFYPICCIICNRSTLINPQALFPEASVSEDKAPETKASQSSARPNVIPTGTEAQHERKHLITGAVREESTPTMCFSCKTEDSQVVCLNCDKHMCRPCLDKHNKHPTNNRHTIIHVNDVVKCEEHQERCGHICRVCRKFVCVCCILNCCGSHACIEIGAAARELLATKAQSRNEGSNHSMKLTKLIAGFKENFTEAQKTLQSRTDRLLNVVSAERQMLLKQVEQIKVCAIKNAHYLEELPFASIDTTDHMDSFNNMEVIALSEGLKSEFIKVLLMLTVCDLESLSEATLAQSLRYVPSMEENTVGPGSLISPGRAKDTSASATTCPPPKPEAKPQPGVRSYRVRGGVKFSKIVYDRRKGCNALVGQYGDIVVRNDFTNDSKNVSLYSAADRGFPAQKRLLKNFKSIFDGDWRGLLPQIRPMTSRAQEYILQNGVDLAYPEIWKTWPVMQTV